MVSLPVYLLFSIAASTACAQQQVSSKASGSIYSEHSSLQPDKCKKKKIIKSAYLQPGINYQCRGPWGYRLIYAPHNGTRLVVKAPGRRYFRLNGYSAGWSIEKLGHNAEWRLRKRLLTDRPVAVIIPGTFRRGKYPASAEPRQGLMIVKITKNTVCATDILEAASRMPRNGLLQRARRTADDAANRKCLR